VVVGKVTPKPTPKTKEAASAGGLFSPLPPPGHRARLSRDLGWSFEPSLPEHGGK
jgi:hypothetical protein